MSAVYVYALLGEAPPPGAGLCDEPLRAVRIDDLVAAVGDMTNRPAVNEATLRAHDAVVRRLADAVDAILPVRFGSLLSESSLTELLRVRAHELRDALVLVAGREQMTLRVLGDAPAPSDTAADAGHGPELGPGARYLAGRRSAWRRAREVPELASLRPALQPLVRAERVTRHDAPPLLASVYHLVDRGRATAYRDVVERSPQTPVQLAVSGPWPPYAFAPEALG
jgi:hypothetical protein